MNTNFIPEEFLQMTYTCKSCNSVNQIDWLRDRGGDMGSIKSKDGKGIFYRLSASEICPICNEMNLINLPVIKKKDEFFLFGDEAFRELNPTTKLYTYSIIGTSKAFIDEIETALRKIKSNFLPVEPDSWTIHMKDLWSGSNRKRNKQFMHLTFNDIKMLLDDISSLFENFGDKIYKTNIMIAGNCKSSKQKMAFDKLLRDETYKFLVLKTIDLTTSNGAEPIFNFDAEKKCEADTVIQKWASDSFKNGCQNILYCFMSHSIPVREPIFVKPGSRPLLELADILSFVVARYNQRLYNKENPDINCSIFGKVNYWTYTEKGKTVVNKLATNYPWNIFH